ncbi:MAG: sarcosine oxidase subunit gamma family protein [Pseudohaliea sp.]
MAELVAAPPLAEKAVTRGAVVLEAVQRQAVLRLRLLAQDASAVRRVEEALGRGLPATGDVVTVDGCRLAGCAPGDWLLLDADRLHDESPIDAALHLQARLGAAAATVTSDGLVTLRIGGGERHRLLARGTTMDVGAVRPGHCARTRFAGVAAVLVAESDAMLLLAARPHAAYLWRWCHEALV